jgi:uncharacterized lipoprotein
MKQELLRSMANPYDLSWIRVPRYVDNTTLTVEQRIQQLHAHHVAETTFLVETIRELANKLLVEDHA